MREVRVGDPFWQAVLDLLRSRVNDYTFGFLSRIEGSAVVGDKITLRLPDPFMRDWIDDHYRAVIQEAVATVHGFPLEIAYETGEPPQVLSASIKAPAPRAAARRAKAEPARHPRLHDRFTFATFVTSGSNQLASAAAEAVGNQPGRAYNPLYIYGGTGLGKTHLLHAIGNRILELRPEARVCYVSSEEFTNEFIARVRDNRMAEFRARYREIDALLLDDVQFLGNKQGTQEEFFHTFNALHDAKKAVVLTSDILPTDIEGLEPRLRSRFQSGLLADVHEPNLEMRCAILKKKAVLEGVAIPDAVAMFLAQHIPRNVRELEGALIKMIAVHSLTTQAISVELAETVLHDILPTPKQVDSDEIQRTVARYFRVGVEEFRQDRRHKQLAHARQVAMFLCRTLTRASLPELGAHFNKDHTTVLAAVRKIERLRETDLDLQRQLTELEGQLRLS